MWIFRHPSKVLYTFFDHYSFLGAFFQKTVKYFWGHMKDADISLHFLMSCIVTHTLRQKSDHRDSNGPMILRS